MVRHEPEAMRRLVVAIATAVGDPDADAAILAESLVDADLHGVSTHGVSRLGIYVRRIQRGLIDPRAPLAIESRRRSTLVVDAGNGLGQVQASKTLDTLTRLARESGVAAATIRRSQHFGALSFYCNRAARDGMILLATTAAEPAVPPEGGYQAYFGTNPLAVSFPTGKGFPVKIDLATSIIARGNIIAARRKGQPIPLGWAVDPNGNPTTDAEQALAGAVLSMAGHKGYALALMIEAFSSVLSGAAIGSSIGSMYKDLARPQDVGHFFCLVDVEAFMDLATFTSRMDRMIDELKASPRRSGVDEILVPGERSSRIALENARSGISIGDETMAELGALCKELGLKFSL